MTVARPLMTLVALALVAGACGDSDSITAADSSVTTVTPQDTVATTAAPATSTTASPPTTAPATATEAPYDPTLTRTDVSCTEGGLAGDSDELFLSAHYIVDGVLGELCFGEEDPTLLAVWELLWTITPSEQFEPLAILAGYDSPDGDTLAYVTTAGDFDGSTFQMSWNLAGPGPADPEFALTAAHEFSHVVVGQVEQLDRFADVGSCDTYDNGEGCFLPGAYLDDWVDEFWTDAELAELRGDQAQEEAGADERCNLNPGFLGVYAATNPDEDFAESFAAFVFQIDVDSPQLEDKLAFYEERPELAAFRDRAVAAGLAGLPNEFDVCG